MVNGRLVYSMNKHFRYQDASRAFTRVFLCFSYNFAELEDPFQRYRK